MRLFVCVLIALSLAVGQASVVAALPRSDGTASQGLTNDLIKGSFGSHPAPSRDKTKDCNSYLTPECIQKMYDMPKKPVPKPPGYKKNTKEKMGTKEGKPKYKYHNNGFTIPGFVDEYANHVDLTRFLSSFRSDLNLSTTFKEKIIDQGQNSQILPGGLDSSLAVQYAVGLGAGVETTLVASGLSDIQGFIHLARHILKKNYPPTVLVIPYGFNEKHVPLKHAGKLCDMFKKLGQRGVSVIASSGNGGVSGISRTEECTAFLPAFPATCPWVTVVGGTTAGVPTERAANFSSGGFSNHFPMPKYQGKLVGEYLNKTARVHSGRYNYLGRAYPDISARATNVVIYRDGKEVLVDGTPAATIIFASMITLLNSELIGKFRPVMGYLNDWLYAHPEIFDDIKVGSNPGCGTDGFPAIQGWDPVTGLGVPNYGKMKKILDL